MRASRYVDEVITFDSLEPDAIQRLDGHLARLRPSLLVVIEERFVEKITVDPSEAAARLRGLLRLHPCFQSRSGFHSWAESRGIPIPPGFICRSGEDVIRCLDQWGTVYLKADGSSAGSGVRKIDTAAEAAEAWRVLGTPNGVLVQKSVAGPVGITDMVVKEGRLQAWIACRKSLTTFATGPSVTRELCAPDGIGELAQKVAAESGFHGLGGFDWIIDPEDNLPRLIEFHPRPPSGFGLGEWAGVSFPRAIASLLDLEPEKLQSPVPSKFSHKPYCCYFPDHPKFVIQNRAWSEMRQWLPGSRARTWSMLPWDDPAIFLAMLGKVRRKGWKR